MKNVISFLRKLQRNNNREWFNAHKDEYKAAAAEFDQFTEGLISGISSFDDTVSGLTPKDCTYRIYRDVRFSGDKSPYKTHMGAYVCKGGKKSGNAGYYLHVEPSQEGLPRAHLLTAGLYMPEPKILQSIREDICYNGEEFLSTVERGMAGGFELGQEGKLKRIPQGYPADSPYAEYLKLKNIDLTRIVDDEFLLSPDVLKNSVEAFSHLHDFVRHLNRAVDYAREEM